MKNHENLISFLLAAIVATSGLGPRPAFARGTHQGATPGCLNDENGCFPDFPGTWQLRVDSTE